MKRIKELSIIAQIFILFFILGTEKVMAIEDPVANISGIRVADVPNDQGGAVKISWEKLTDIAVPYYENKNYVGYQVYHQEQPVVWGGYVHVCDTPSLEVTTCLDDKAEVGKQYHYWVVGYYLYNDYNTKEELKQGSHIVEDRYVAGKSVDNLAPAKPVNVQVSNKENNLGIYWQKNAEPDMLNYSVNFYLDNGSDSKPTKSFIAYGPEFTVELDKYYKDYKFISIQARDKNENLSAKADLIAIPESTNASVNQKIYPPHKASSVKFPSSKEDYFSIAGLSAILLVLVLYIVYRVHEKKTKKTHEQR